MNSLTAPGLLRKSQTKVQIPWSPPVERFGMRSRVRKEAERDALRLANANFREGLAVEPAGICNRLGIQVREAKFDAGILGALFLKPGANLEMILNRRHSFLRRRLTCALELGHYVWMSARTDEYKRVDLFEGFEEIGGEANDDYAREFAASLLMPKEDVKTLVDLWMDDLEMSLRFRVPRESMRSRLKALGFRIDQLEGA
jgi:Zn-dependent peptidase ImmA (M78 family)